MFSENMMQMFHRLGDETGINQINIETDGGKVKAIDVGVPVPVPVPVPIPLLLDSIGLQSLKDVTVEFTTFKFDDDQVKVLESLNNSFRWVKMAETFFLMQCVIHRGVRSLGSLTLRFLLEK